MKTSEQKNKTSLLGVLLLVLTSLIWGTSFISQSEGSKLVEPFTFNGIRTLLGAIVLVPVILIRDKKLKSKLSAQEVEQKKVGDKKTLIYGSLLGVALCLATNFQQFAFVDPNHSAGKIAFITAMYMFIVPILGFFFGKKVPLSTWICVLIAIIGLYFLCIDERGLGSITVSDILALICALFFSVQILLIEKYAPECDGIKLSCVQFFSSGIISCILMFIFETPKFSSIKAAAFPIMYSGIMSCGVAYTLQIAGQKYCEATIASMIMCLESVFAALSEAAFGALFMIGGKVLSFREWIGCAIMFSAIILSQVLQNKKTAETK